MLRRLLQPGAFLRRLIYGRVPHYKQRGYYYDYRVDRCHQPVEHWRAGRK